MKLLQNPEVRRPVQIYLAFALAATALGFFMSPVCGLFALVICAVSLLFFLLVTGHRYRRIEELTRQLSTVLHSGAILEPGQEQEGELSILSTEIYKMTLRLQEQAEVLSRDKLYLRDSLADLSHQLRTPLTSMQLIASRLNRPELSQQEKLSLVLELKKLLSQVEWLISALLKLSQLESGTVPFQNQRVSLTELTETALAPLQVQLELKGLTLQMDISPEAGFQGDLLWSAQALGNVLKNCVEHTPEGGIITITGTENPLDTQLTVRDTGPGISPEELPHIFERFYRGSARSQHGFGIGLALAKLILERQNGSIRAGNADMGGALFEIRFSKGAV